MIGRTLGRYRILESVGEGGMGVVYRARDERLGRDVALKVLNREAVADPSARERLRREAKLLSQINHPSIATVFDFDTLDGVDFLVMELIEGEALDRRLARGPVSEPEALDLALQLAHGLEAAHAGGVIHRDLKPGNIMVTSAGRLKILDFGLARPWRAPDDERTMLFAESAGVSGTLAYMAPEQLRGAEADLRADIYGAGATLYEMVTGRRPHPEEGAALIDAVLNRSPDPARKTRPGVSRGMEAVLQKALEKDPRRRFASAGELGRALAALVRSPHRRRSLTWAAGGIAVAAVAFLLAWIVAGGRAGAETQTVSVTDEEGQVTERILPGPALRRRLGVFFFTTPDTTRTWMGFAAGELLSTDLSQDLALGVVDGYALLNKAEPADSREALAITLPRMRSLAKESHLPFFVSGTIEAGDTELKLTVDLQDTEKHREISRRSYNGTLAAVVEKASRQIRLDLGLPESYVESTESFPIDEIYTSSDEALRLYVEASVRAVIDKDYAGAVPLLEEAVKLDPEFAMAHASLGQLGVMIQDMTLARKSTEASMKLLYRIPEKYRFLLKALYYLNIENDYDRGLAVVKMWVQVLPQDISAHEQLAGLLMLRNEIPGAIEQYEKVLELNPNQGEILQNLGELYEDQNDFENAERYYRLYADRFPSTVDSFLKLASLYDNFGKFDQAAAELERALLLEPTHVLARLDLLHVGWERGKYREAEPEYPRLLAIAATSQESLAVLGNWRGLLALQGRLNEAVEVLERENTIRSRTLPPFMYQARRLRALSTYLETGRFEDARGIVADVHRHLAPPMDQIASLGETAIYLETKEADAAEAALERVKVLFQLLKLDYFAFGLEAFEGRVWELRGDFTRALEFHEQARIQKPRSLRILSDVARCRRELGQYREAEEALATAASLDPVNGHIQLEWAFLREAEGRIPEAREHLDRALSVWREADSTYTQARQARELRVKITATP